MPSDLMSNPVVLGVAIILIVAITLLIILLLGRSNRRKRKDDSRMRAELAAMEREKQFEAAAEQSSFRKEPSELARQVASIFREYLSMPVLALYAGREQEASLPDILTGAGPVSDELSSSSDAGRLPDRVPASLLRQYARPQITRLSALAGSNKAAPSTAGEQPREGETSGDEQRAATARGPYDTDRLDRGEQPSGIKDIGNLAVFPWHGPFGWNGLIVALVEVGTDAGTLERYDAAVARLGDRLGVALEIEQERSELKASDERASRSATFFQSLIAALEDPTPLASIAREVTELVDADSSAIWRVEPGSSMVRMVAAFGLRSAEFLPLPVGQGLAGSVIEGGQPLAVLDAPSDPRCLFPREARESGISSYLGAPVKVGDEAIGVVEVHTAQPRNWSETDISAMQSAATIIGEVMKSTDVRGNRLRVESAYLGLSEAMQRLRSPGEVMDAVVEVLGHALGVSRAVVVEFESEGQPATITHEYTATSIKPLAGTQFDRPAAERLMGATDGEVVAIKDSRERSLMGAEMANGFQVLSEMAAPIRFEGRTHALLYIHQCDRVREWQPDEVEFADRVARQLSLSLSNAYSLDRSVQEAEAAREDARRLTEAGGRVQKIISEMQQKTQDLERKLSEARSSEAQARSEIEKAMSGKNEILAEVEALRRAESEAREQVERLGEELDRALRSSQELLERDLLKSDFIINAGREVEASLQSVLGLAELLGQGAYGNLTGEQFEAAREIYTSARRMKDDIDFLIEYISMRQRRLEPGEQTA